MPEPTPNPSSEPSPAVIAGAGTTGPGGSTGSGPTSNGSGTTPGRAVGPMPAPAPGPHDLPTTIANAVSGAASDVALGVTTVVKPAAAASVATTFSFPLALMAMVALFLIAQPRIDRRDPRLRALQTADDTDLGFEEEDRL